MTRFEVHNLSLLALIESIILLLVFILIRTIHHSWEPVLSWIWITIMTVEHQTWLEQPFSQVKYECVKLHNVHYRFDITKSYLFLPATRASPASSIQFYYYALQRRDPIFSCLEVHPSSICLTDRVGTNKYFSPIKTPRHWLPEYIHFILLVPLYPMA